MESRGLAAGVVGRAYFYATAIQDSDREPVVQ
jgi:hypothetical protein